MEINGNWLVWLAGTIIAIHASGVIAELLIRNIIRSYEIHYKTAFNSFGTLRLERKYIVAAIRAGNYSRKKILRWAAEKAIPVKAELIGIIYKPI